jgi:hypothetical protein
VWLGVADTLVREGTRITAAVPDFHQLSAQKLIDFATTQPLAAGRKGLTHRDRHPDGHKKKRYGSRAILGHQPEGLLVGLVELAQTQSQYRPLETVTSTVGQIAFGSTKFRADGTKGDGDSFKWNITANKAI